MSGPDTTRADALLSFASAGRLLSNVSAAVWDRKHGIRASRSGSLFFKHRNNSNLVL
jgi:hypothetical protein